MQNTTHYNLKKPDYTDFADIQDINENMDTIDAELAAPTGDGRDQTVSFTDADLDSGITSFPNFLTKVVSGMKLAKFLRDFKAGMAYVLHTGSLINNATCTESGKALDARMGKTLQDQITSLNDSLSAFKLVDSRTMNNDTVRTINVEHELGDVTISESGFYLLISETSTSPSYNGRSLARFTGNGVQGLNTFVPPVINGYGYVQVVQFIRVESSVTISRKYFDTVQTASTHIWAVYKIIG